MAVTKTSAYKKAAHEEAKSWDKAATGELKKFPPDYKYYRETLPYKVYRCKFVKKMLTNIYSKDQILELGCYNGWFSLEMARKGANIDAYDISPKAIEIAKKYYTKIKNKEHFSGDIKYFVSDLNFPHFPNKKYDKIIIRNVLHHLINLDTLFKKLSKSLKITGQILIDDALPCGKKEALITGILLTLLPTDIPYKDKIRRIFKKGHILKRTQGLVDACGASPFEGASGKESVELLNKYFKLNNFYTFAAFVGTITAQLNSNKIVKLFILNSLNLLDLFLIKIGLLKGTSYYLEATYLLRVEYNK